MCVTPPHTFPHLPTHPATLPQVGYLKGISWIYTNNMFLYMFLAIAFLTAIYMAFKGPKMWERKK